MDSPDLRSTMPDEPAMVDSADHSVTMTPSVARTQLTHSTSLRDGESEDGKKSSAVPERLGWLCLYILFPVAILAIAVPIAFVLFHVVRDSEDDLAVETFKSEYSPKLQDIESRLNNVVLTIRQLAAAVAIPMGGFSVVTSAIYQTITQPLQTLYPDTAIMLVARFENNADGLDAFKANTTARLGFAVPSVITLGAASVGEADTFYVVDQSPVTLSSREGLPALPPYYTLALGIGSDPRHRAAIEALDVEAAADPTQRPASVTGITFVRDRPRNVSYVMSSVFPDDPTRAVVVYSFTIPKVDEIVEEAGGAVVGSATSHDGGTVHYAADNTCDAQDDLSVTLDVSLTATITWTFVLNGCQGYKDTFYTNRPYLLAGLVIGIGVLTAVGWIILMIVFSSKRQSDLHTALLMENEATHARLLGFVCHTVRNPLHCLETWVTPPGDGPDPREGLDEAELRIVDSDIQEAVQQLKSTVTDIKALTRVESANPGQFLQVDEHVIVPVLMDVLRQEVCRLPETVTLEYALPKKKTGLFDKDVVQHALGVAVRNAARYCSRGKIMVNAGIVSLTSKRFLVVSVRNTRLRSRMEEEDVKGLFIPFAGHADEHLSKRGVWGPAHASPRHVKKMEKVWASYAKRAPSTGIELVTAEPRIGDSRYSAGLSLPIARAQCKVAGGWFSAIDPPLEPPMTVTWFIVPVGDGRSTGMATPTAIKADSLAPYKPNKVAPAPLGPEDQPGPLSSPGLPTPFTDLSTPVTAQASANQPPTGRIVVAPASSSRGSLSEVPALHHASSSASSSAADAPSGSGALPNKPPVPAVIDYGALTVLIVDDESVNQRILSRLLTKLGVPKPSISLLNNGQELVDFVNDPSSTTPSIVFLDLMMPKMSGMEAMEAVRPGCPVVAATGNVDDSTTSRCQRLGFSGMLGKPFGGDNLKESIDRALRDSPYFVF